MRTFDTKNQGTGIAYPPLSEVVVLFQIYLKVVFVYHTGILNVVGIVQNERFDSQNGGCGRQLCPVYFTPRRGNSFVNVSSV